MFGEGAEVMMVYGRHEDTCPVSTLRRWLDAAAITAGPVFKKVNKTARVEPRRLSEEAVRQFLLKRAAEAGISALQARHTEAPEPAHQRLSKNLLHLKGRPHTDIEGVGRASSSEAVRP
jgi:hypothetical protein